MQRESLLAFNNFCGILNEPFRESMLSRHSYFLPSVIAHYPSFQKNEIHIHFPLLFFLVMASHLVDMAIYTRMTDVADSIRIAYWTYSFM